MRVLKLRSIHHVVLWLLAICVCLRAVAMPHVPAMQPVVPATVHAAAATAQAHHTAAASDCADHDTDQQAHPTSDSNTPCQIDCALANAAAFPATAKNLLEARNEWHAPGAYFILIGVKPPPEHRPPIA